jgi:hypothetical protein
MIMDRHNEVAPNEAASLEEVEIILEDLNLDQAFTTDTAFEEILVEEEVVENSSHKSSDEVSSSSPAISTLASPAGFCYETLQPSVASDAKAAAERIRKKIDSVKQNFIEIGRELLQIKDKLEHGEFGKWIVAEFEMTGRTAQNYMSVAKEFGDKPEMISVLPPTAIYKLAARSTPAAVIEGVLADIAEGVTPTTQEISTRIADAKEKEASIRAEAAATPSSKTGTKQERLPRRREGVEKEKTRCRSAALEAIKLLKDALGTDFARFCVLYRDAGEEFSAALKPDIV